MRFLASRVGDAFWRARCTRLLSVRVATDFLQQSHYPAPLRAGVRVTAADERQLVLGSALFQDGQCVGLQSATLRPSERGEPVAMPAPWLQALRDPLPAGDAEPLPADDGGALRPASFPQRRMLDSRFADLDATGRTSELAWMRAAETGRSALLRAAFSALGADAERAWLGLLAARVDLHVHRHRPAPPQWQLGAGVTHMGRSSVVLRVAFFDGADECLAHADCVLVFVDRDRGSPVTVPDAVRGALEQRRMLG